MLRDICDELTAIRERIEALADTLAAADIPRIQTVELIEQLSRAHAIINSVRHSVEAADPENN